MALVVVAIWIGAILFTDWLRSDRVETWSGPDATVQSGVNLNGCSFPSQPVDRAFPVWLRYGGRLYQWGELTLPVSEASVGTKYAPTGYTLGGLTLMTIEDTPDGQARTRLMIRNDHADGGAVYLAIPECA